jgi:hypothetical protein
MVVIIIREEIKPWGCSLAENGTSALLPKLWLSEISSKYLLEN